MSENAVLSGSTGVADRIARRTLARRGPDYPGEVRRLLDAGLDVMRKCGTSSRPRVADIVASAGLSNDTFYRHFSSKEALVAAILEDGTERLASYLAHRMAKQPTPEGRVRQWVEGVLSQAADDEVAAATLAVLWNAGAIGTGVDSPPPSASEPLATLLRDPFAELGSVHAELDASLVAHATVGKLGDYLWRRARPRRDEIDHIVEFCLAAATARTTKTAGRR